jgi:hypothetical protein
MLNVKFKSQQREEFEQNNILHSNASGTGVFYRAQIQTNTVI